MHRLITTLALTALTLATHAQQQPMRLWYDRPARLFEQSLPIGNGKLGALVYGAPDCDTGKPVDLSVDSTAHRWIPAIRQALFNENYPLADSLQHHVQGHNSQFYEPLGTLRIYDLNEGATTDYRRELDLDSALCRDRYTRGGITYRREYFASHPDKVIAVRIKSSTPKAINVRLAIGSLVPHGTKAANKQLTMTGTLSVSLLTRTGSLRRLTSASRSGARSFARRCAWISWSDLKAVRQDQKQPA